MREGRRNPSRQAELNPGQVVAALVLAHNLSPHPEGGFYREIYRSSLPVLRADGETRHAVTVIVFLLPGEIETRWHKVAAEEIWHFLAGSPLQLTQTPGDSPDRAIPVHTTLGPIGSEGVSTVGIVPPGSWQKARTTGSYSLVTCTVSPGFTFDDFILLDQSPHPAPARRS